MDDTTPPPPPQQVDSHVTVRFQEPGSTIASVDFVGVTPEQVALASVIVERYGHKFMDQQEQDMASRTPKLHVPGRVS